MTKVYRAVYDFEKTDEEELSINAGDNLLAIGDDEGGWLEVQNLETGLKGYVPTEYLELDESASNENTVPTATENNQSPPIIQAPPVLAPPVPAIPIPDINITNNNISNNNNLHNNSQDSPSESQNSMPLNSDASNFNQNQNRSPENAGSLAAPTRKPDFEASSFASKGDANTTKHDPIESIVGKTGSMFSHFRKQGVEDYVNGMAKGDGNPKFNQSNKFLFAEPHSGGVMTVKGQKFEIDSSSENLPFTLVIEKGNKDQKDRQLFSVQGPRMTTLRTVDDFKWLEESLRKKYPFVNIPQGPFASGRPSHIPMGRWMDYITAHPYLRASYSLYVFTHISDPKTWKDVKKTLDKNDKNLNQEMFRLIDVYYTEEDKNGNLQEKLRDVIETTKANQESYKKGFENSINCLKRASDLERSKIQVYHNLGKSLGEWSDHLQKISRPGCGQMSIGLNKVANEMFQLSSQEVSKEKMLAASVVCFFLFFHFVNNLGKNYSVSLKKPIFMTTKQRLSTPTINRHLGKNTRNPHRPRKQT